MARKTSTDAESAVAAPKKDAFKRAVKAYASHKEKSSDEAKAIINAVEHVHAGVFKTIGRLDAMDPVKRGEWLFHFDVARDFYDWLKAEPSLGLPDRPKDAKAKDGEPDLRPRHLRQPGASVASADDPPKGGSASVTVLDPKRRSVKDAADAAEKIIPDPSTKH